MATALTRLSLVLLILAGLVTYVVHAALVLGYPFELSYGEGTVLCYTTWLQQGQLYPPIDTPPYRVCIYPPLFMALSALVMGAHPTLAAGRLISVLSTLLTVLVAGAYVRWRTHLMGGVIVAGVFLLNAVPLAWFALNRIDMLALALTCCGLCLTAWSRSRRRDWRLDLACAALFALAALAKHSFLAGAAASLAYLLFTDRIRFLRMAVFYALLLGGPLTLLNLASGGEAIRQMVTYNGSAATIYLKEQALEWGSAYALSISPMLVIVGVFAVRGGLRKEAFWFTYLALSTGIAVGIGRLGGFYNYFLEFHLAICMLAGLALGQTEVRWAANLAALGQAVIGFLWFLPPYLYSPCDYLIHETGAVLEGRYPGYLRKGLETAQMQPWLDHFGGPILAEQAHTVLYGHTPWLCDPSFFYFMILRGDWDEERLLQPIRERRFPVILLLRTEGNARFSPKAIHAILDNYDEVGVAGADRIFRPKSR